MKSPQVVFADASFYIAAMIVRDQSHERAIAWQQALLAAKTRIVTSEGVLWEWLNFCAPRALRRRAFTVYTDIHNDPTIDVVGFDEAVVQEARNLYRSHDDKEWGITDCLSFAIMTQRGLTAALTADQHFEQAGFTALLLQDPQ